jgi:hypothetical protein
MVATASCAKALATEGVFNPCGVGGRIDAGLKTAELEARLIGERTKAALAAA